MQMSSSQSKGTKDVFHGNWGGIVLYRFVYLTFVEENCIEPATTTAEV